MGEYCGEEGLEEFVELGANALGEDGPEHAYPIAPRMKVTNSVAPIMLKTGHLVNTKPGSSCSNVHECLDLEALTIRVNVRQATAPEGIVTVTEIAIAPAPYVADDLGQAPVAYAAEACDI